jgi:hypothetical protein
MMLIHCAPFEIRYSRLTNLFPCPQLDALVMARSRISVESSGDAVYRVMVTQGGDQTRHEVTVTAEDLARYAPGSTPERLLEASFQFLLEREPASSILSRFALPVIERYFPEYPKVIRQMV